MDAVVKENADLTSKLRETRQELVKERSQVCQLTSEKVEALQQLHVSNPCLLHIIVDSF
jgi:ribosomal protein L29